MRVSFTFYGHAIRFCVNGENTMEPCRTVFLVEVSSPAIDNRTIISSLQFTVKPKRSYESSLCDAANSMISWITASDFM